MSVTAGKLFPSVTQMHGWSLPSPQHPRVVVGLLLPMSAAAFRKLLIWNGILFASVALTWQLADLLQVCERDLVGHVAVQQTRNLRGTEWPGGAVVSLGDESSEKS